MILQPQSTRLFPKGRGADAYTISGLAARCDWVVLSDNHPPHVHLHCNRTTDHPRHIFLSLRAPFHAVRHFTKVILPRIRSDFVLITGSEDITLPRQRDARWRRFDAAEQAMLAQILNHPHLRHWYAENLDEGGHPRRSPLPLGLVFPQGAPEGLLMTAPPPLAQRPLRVFCAHRHRDGPQWEPRRRVSRLAGGPWRDYCTTAAQEMPEPAFMAEVEAHAFVLCVEGGGLDPSPKAWSALLHGAIPIIRKTAVAQAYTHLPVVVVDDWTGDALTPAWLAHWRAAFLPWFDDPFARHEILHRLSLDYWWRIIASARPVKDKGTMAPLPPQYAASGGVFTLA